MSYAIYFVVGLLGLLFLAISLPGMNPKAK